MKEDPQEVERVLNDFGQAVKELAMTGIWVGDLHLKNYGVTEYGRVVYFDYDEIGPLVEYQFMEHLPPHVPAPEDGDYTMDTDYLDKVVYKRVAVRRLMTEMAIQQDERNFFSKVHGDLLTVEFWEKIQQRLRNQEAIEILPYPESELLRPVDGTKTSTAHDDQSPLYAILVPPIFHSLIKGFIKHFRAAFSQEQKTADTIVRHMRMRHNVRVIWEMPPFETTEMPQGSIALSDEKDVLGLGAVWPMRSDQATRSFWGRTKPISAVAMLWSPA